MKKLVLSVSVLALAALFASCSKSSNSSPSTASVMFVNGSDGTTPVNSQANGASVSGASNIAFQGNSNYQNVTAGSSVNLAFILASSGLPLVSGSANLVAGGHYTAYAGGKITAPTFTYTSDDLTAPTSGNAKVRLVNLSSDSLSLTGTIATTSGSINFGSSSSPLVSGSLTTSAFTSVAAGSYKIVVEDPLHLASTVILNSQTFAAGKIYTVIYTGVGAGTGTSVYTATVISNN
jgi:hypothetical protein